MLQQCKRCGNDISEKRSSLGYTTCTLCGDYLAWKEIQNKQKRVGPLYNKGGDQYLGSEEEARKILKTEGPRKHLPYDTEPSPRRKQPPQQTRGRRNQVGPTPTPTEPKQSNPPLLYKARPSKWVFDHWEFPNDKLGHRTKRAVLRLKLTPTKPEAAVVGKPGAGAKDEE